MPNRIFVRRPLRFLKDTTRYRTVNGVIWEVTKDGYIQFPNIFGNENGVDAKMPIEMLRYIGPLFRVPNLTLDLSNDITATSRRMLPGQFDFPVIYYRIGRERWRYLAYESYIKFVEELQTISPKVWRDIFSLQSVLTRTTEHGGHV